MPKSTKKTYANRLYKPFTPLRRFFFKLELFAPSPNVPALLGKRRHEGLPEDEAGFEHLHAYDYAASVENVLERRQGNDSSDPIRVYAPDGSRSWTKKPAGPRSLRPPRRNAQSNSTLPKERGSQSPILSPSATPRPRQYARRQGTARIALQNIDSTLGDDAVIITALESVPFNSHEDLLAMTREELVQVAQSLNEKLPLALSIDVGDERPLSFIRNAIEVLVGIRPEVPAAPLRIGTKKMLERENPRFFEDFSFEKRLEEMESSSPATSPLSMRVKSGNWSAHLHELLRHPQRLEPLHELTEEEERGSSISRKRRKLSSGDKLSQGDIVMQCASQDVTSLPPSAESFRVGLPNSTAVEFQLPEKASTRVLRSHSQRVLGRVSSVDSNSSTPEGQNGANNAKTDKRRRAKRRCQKSTECSAKAKRNSVVFPSFNNPIPANRMFREPGSNSSTSASAGTTSDYFLSSSGANSPLLQSEYSADASGSAFLSTKSALSSTSKMSVCTRSTTGGTQVNKVDGMPTGGPVDMDISV